MVEREEVGAAVRMICHLLIHFLAEGERELLLGDIEELRLRDGQAMRELLGFLLRRWLVPFCDWRVWAGAIGFIWLAWMPMLRDFFFVFYGPSRLYTTYKKYDALYESGLSFQQDLYIWCSQLALLLLFCWSSGYALALISRRNLVVATGLVVAAVFGSWTWLSFSFGRIAIIAGIQTAVLLTPAWAGALRYLRRGPMRPASIVVLVCATFSLIGLQAWMSGWFQEAMLVSDGDISWLHTTAWYQRIQPWLVVSCPVIFLVVERWIGVRKVAEV